MIPSKARHHQRAPRHAGRKTAAALAASISALILTAAGAPAAFAVPAGYPAEGPSAGATATPDHHTSTPGMDPNMPGMTHDETPGMDPNMPGMTHDETPGMDPNMPGLSGSAVTGKAFAYRNAPLLGVAAPCPAELAGSEMVNRAPFPRPSLCALRVP